ncbi:MAG: MBL fold metallo-hydrolase [Acidobacteria bacterium]|nr:MAG: MBL fold metallo-hydrolase [Acidobacteriota bacterium]
MRVHFWGVRGSVPYATPASIGHGCNTPCLEVVDESSGRRLILDAGSGIVGVGNALTGVTELPIVLTHYHWDHVQGLPFFAPLYRSGTAVTVWAPTLGREFGDIESMFEAPFFPVPYDRLPSRPAIQMNAGGRVEINGFDVSTQLLNHPGGSFAYRIKSGKGDVVYATDHEFGNADIDLALAHFAVGAHALILDAHFTPEEMPFHKGWGHSDWMQCARFAAGCGVKRLWLFHHKPGRSDSEIDEIETAAKKIFPETRAAKEGDEF